MSEENSIQVQESTALITIKQLPEIVENLRLLRERWERAAADAESLVCTEESVQSMKDARAQMRKEFEEADTQRKAAKSMYMAPWEQVEKVWKECVADPFKKADNAFKDEIGSFEGRLRDKCLENIKRYYSELCIASSVECLSLEKAMELGNIKISLSDAKARTPKKLQDSLAEIVNRVGADIDQIQLLDESIRDEVYVEFKKTYNLGASVATVQDRHRKIEEAKKAAEERAEAQARAQEAADKVMAAAPSAVPAAAPAVAHEVERVFPEFTFTVYNCTRSQLIKIRDFLKGEGINYE